MEILQDKINFSKPNTAPKEDNLIYDLGLLAAFDPISINSKLLKDSSTKEEALQNAARDDIQLFFNRIFELPTQRIENGVAAMLPAPITKLPRQKPVPKPKPLTKWQQYAKEKGIKKKKRDTNKVYDAATDEFKPKWGANRIKQEERDWIIPAKATDQVGSDPFLEKQQAKKERVQKNKQRHEENLKRAKQQSGLPATIAISDNAPSKIPLNQRKDTLTRAFAAAQTATISMGKFDKTLNEEKKPKMKRKLDTPVMTAEKEKTKNLRLFERITAAKGKVDIAKATSQAIVQQQHKRSVTVQPSKKRRK